MVRLQKHANSFLAADALSTFGRLMKRAPNATRLRASAAVTAVRPVTALARVAAFRYVFIVDVTAAVLRLIC